MGGLKEKRWSHTIPASKLHSAISNYDIEGIKCEIIAICSRIESYLEDEYDIYTIQDIKQEAEDIDRFTEEDQIDFILEELYSFCDSTNIWLAPDKLDENIIYSDETLSDNVVSNNLIDLGISSLISDTIKKEWELIDQYNTLLATLVSENKDKEIIASMQTLIDNTTINIGQLEKILTSFSSIAIKGE